MRCIAILINMQRGSSYLMPARGKQLDGRLLWAGDLQEGYCERDVDTCMQPGAVDCDTRAWRAVRAQCWPAAT